MSYFNSITQNVHLAYDVSTILVPGATYIGAPVSTLGVAGIQFSVKSDKNLQVYIEQSPDNVNWDISDIHNYYSNGSGNGWTDQALSSYTRIKIVNTSDTSTSYVRGQLVLCPIVEALPRKLSEEGNLKVGVYEIESEMGVVRVSPMGSLKVGENIRLAGANYNGSIIDTNYWINASTGSGNASQANGEYTLSTGTIANSGIRTNSVKIARYIAGSSNYFRGVVQIPSVTTGSAGHTNANRFGAFDSSNGYFFESYQTYPATTPTLKIVARKNGVDSSISSGAFNGDWGTSLTIDTSVHTYELWWTNLIAYYYVDNKLLHTLRSKNTTAVATTNLKIGLETVNSGGNTSNNTIISRALSINRLGNARTISTYKQISTNATFVLKYGAGELHQVINTDSTGSISIYDGISAAGTLIAVIDCTKIFGTLTFAVAFSEGLTVVTTGTPKLTITYE